MSSRKDSDSVEKSQHQAAGMFGSIISPGVGAVMGTLIGAGVAGYTGKLTADPSSCVMRGPRSDAGVSGGAITARITDKKS